jgi:hypothetical protein
VGRDAFAVPTRAAGGVAWRMLYVGVLYDPRKQHTVYVTDYDLAAAARLRSYAIVFRLGAADTLVALTDAGKGLDRVLRQNFSGALQLALDWPHEAERLHKFAGLRHSDTAAATAWAEAAKGVLWERGGAALRDHLRGVVLPADADNELSESLRRLQAHYEANQQRTDYPRYRQLGWDVGSGPTEAGCKVLAGRVRGTGMRWGVAASEEVAALRALYASGEGLWDAFWAPPRRRAA